MLARVVSEIPPAAARILIDRFWPGPLTLILRKHRRRALDLVTAGSTPSRSGCPPTRSPNPPEKHATAPGRPSANPFGYLSPTRADHVARHLGERVDAIVNGGPAEHGVESTILMLEPAPVLLRPGAIPIEAIEAVIGPVARGLDDARLPLAPGACRSTTRRTRRSAWSILQRCRWKRPAHRRRLGFVQPRPATPARVLSAHASLREAAAVLFELLHELDVLSLGADRRRAGSRRGPWAWRSWIACAERAPDRQGAFPNAFLTENSS